MKNKIIAITLILLTGSMLTSCDESHVNGKSTPPDPNRIEVLENQIAAERQLREEAQAKIEQETAVRNRWQMASFGLAVVALIGFFGGTAIGSRGRQYANSTS